MSQVICQSCGNSVRDTARFCPRCGGAVGQWTPPSAVENWPPQQQAAPSPPPQPQPDPYQQHYQPDPYNQQPYQPDPYHQQNPYQQPQIHQQFYINTPPQQPVVYAGERKDKTTAILLAVFLGFWTWLYTYKKDAWKFWLCLGLHLTIFNPLWTWILGFLPNIALGIWAIVDVAVKPQQFYDYYPNG